MNKEHSLLTASLASKSVVDRVVDQLTMAIISGELSPGDKIPTELELSESFEVGRNSVREAVKILTAFGVLEVRRAEGTFVRSGFSHRMLDPMLYGLILQKDSAREITELRQVFDTGILQVAIEKADTQAIDKIKIALSELNTAMQGAEDERMLDADVAFHDAIIRSTNNLLIQSTADYINRITIPSRRRTVHRILENGAQKSFIELHARIVEVIEKRQGDRIAETIRDHYQFWRKETGGEEQSEEK